MENSRQDEELVIRHEARAALDPTNCVLFNDRASVCIFAARLFVIGGPGGVAPGRGRPIRSPCPQIEIFSLARVPPMVISNILIDINIFPRVLMGILP